MERFNWSEEYEIGINVIDQQHRRIVDYINTLADMDDNVDQAVLADLINSLIDYTFSHFAFEESLMEEANYDFLEIHKNTHEAFTKKILKFQRQFNNGDDISKELGEMLFTWLIDHILSDDQSYAPLLREEFDVMEKKSNGQWLKNQLKQLFN